MGENASSVVKKFLSNGDSKISEKDRAQAKKLGYSMYEVMTIASIIQKEAGSEKQMKTISSVIHNRLSDKTNFPSLGCQSTSDYITNFVKPNLSSTSAHTADYYLEYYNTQTTSTVVGLPAGPICNPGKAAIQAALHPSDTGYYYFFHDTKGNLYTAKTYAEFKQKIQTYAPIWLHDEAGGTVVPGRGYGTAGIGSQVRRRCGVCGRNPIRYALQPINFDPAQLQAACKLVHAAGKKLYLTCNTLPRSYELDALPDFLRSARAAGVDAFIIADMGVLAIATGGTEVEVHISPRRGSSIMRRPMPFTKWAPSGLLPQESFHWTRSR